LWTWQGAFGFHKMQGVSWLAEEIFNSQEWLWSRLTVIVCLLNASQWDYYLCKMTNTVYCLLFNAVFVLQYQSETKALYTYTLTAGTYNLTLV
jgi:hypothetical protein